MTIVVTGATGNVGRLLVRQLIAGGHRVRAVTRSRLGASALPDQAEIHLGDPSNPDIIGEAIDGAAAIFVNPRAVGMGADRLLAMAAERGVGRAVVLSAINVDDNPAQQPSRLNGDRNAEVERAVVDSGMEWVALRPTWFPTNAIGMYAPQIRSGDVVRGAYADFAESPIDLADLAEVATLALTRSDLVGRKVALTGPESLNQRELVDRLGQALGRPLTFEEVPPEIARQGMLAAGLNEEFVDAYFARMRRGIGVPAAVGPELERLLGRRPATFAEWAVRHTHAFDTAA